MPSGKKRKRHKMATHKRKKRLRKTDIRRSKALSLWPMASSLLQRGLVAPCFSVH